MRLPFVHPELALLLLAALAVAGIAAAALLRRRRALAAFAGAGVGLASASPARQVTKLVLLAVACFSLALTLVGPQFGEAPRRTPTTSVDTVIALDVSQSMAAKDVDPDRLHVAQKAIEQLGKELAGGRIGLTLFAGTSVLRYPLTADTKIVGSALDTSGRGFKIVPGSSLRAALQGAAAAFPTGGPADSRPKAIVVVSDGEDLTPDLPALDPLRLRNISVFTVGIGTTQGASIPVYDQKGQLVQYLVNVNGTQVTSRLDEGRLDQIARQGGGRYFHYQGEETAREVADSLRAIDVGGAPVPQSGVSPEDRYQIFLGIAVLALLAEWLLDERRPMPRPRLGAARPLGRRRALGTIGGALLLLIVGCGPTDPLAADVDAANDTYQRDPAAAVQLYRKLVVQRPTSPEIAIDLANALARTGDLDRALLEYGRALDNAKGKTRAIAFYGRGSALFHQGRLLEARNAFVESLRLDATDRDAKFNIEVIDRLLRQVESSSSGPRASASPTQSGPPQGSAPAGGSPGPTGPSGPGAPSGTPPPGASPQPGGTPPPNVQTALTDFRKDLTVDEALRLLDALRREQPGIEGLINGTGVRRGGNLDVPY